MNEETFKHSTREIDPTGHTRGTIRGRARKALAVILRFCKKHEFTLSGGEIFYSGAAWKERGESWGNGAILCFTYDGGYLWDALSGEFGYKLEEELDAALNKAGFWREPMTSWCSAIYKNEDA